MSIKSIEKDDKNQLYCEYFSSFNFKLYDSPIFIQEEKALIKSELNYQSTEESLSNNFIQNMNNLNIEDKFIPLNLLDLSPIKDQIPENEEKTDIKPELHKFILPKSLFNSGSHKNKQNEEENKSKIISDNNKVDDKDSVSDDNSFIKHLNLLSQPFVPKNKIIPSFLFNSNDYLFNAKAESIKKKREERRKKKNNFVKREGDWICYKCKNLNFAFRSICNKCKLPKKESENQLFDLGKELRKLADLSIGNKPK